MIVAGVMSGTSVDGIDVALVRITRASARSLPRLTLLGHAAFPYPADVRRRILVSMNSPRASVAELARLNFLLGELYAEAVVATQKKLRTQAELIGCHGQTLYHQGTPAQFLGRELAVTWQTGEGSLIAAGTGVPVVSDFRPADMARGGKGAPLVPYLDYLLYRDRRIGRIALNLGGIANLTAVPAAAALNQIVAFDTGPGNMGHRRFSRGIIRPGVRPRRQDRRLRTGDRRSDYQFFEQPPLLCPEAAPYGRTRRVRPRICSGVPAQLASTGRR